MIRLLVALVLLSGPVWAEDYDSGYYEDYGQQPQPRQKYNSMEDRWETVQGEKQLKYNPHEDEWSYQNRDAQPVYNPMEGKWEYPK